MGMTFLGEGENEQTKNKCREKRDFES